MKKVTFFLAVIIIATTGCLNAQKNGGKAAEVKLTTQQDSASYAYGVIVGNSIKRQLSVDLNQEAMLAGLSAAMGDQKPEIAIEACNDIFSAYNQVAMVKAGEAAKAAGEKFLADNKAKNGVTTTASGLQYEVIKKGSGGKSPKATDEVTVHYHGTLIDGTVFDSSVDRGEPATFALNQVIPGWTEGVQLMQVGDKYRFVLPSNLAYGDRGAGGKIKPNSVLVFEVELLGIK
ncbi:MAG: FKBP-type peptidyl-prolyl cis-trans isomerase [Lewinellaceae bacterium]|nr:FKBP-type peptidyl-prolyl cis-trans isomerase [Lewinellaceae bacterium]